MSVTVPVSVCVCVCAPLSGSLCLCLCNKQSVGHAGRAHGKGGRSHTGAKKKLIKNKFTQGVPTEKQADVTQALKDK